MIFRDFCYMTRSDRRIILSALALIGVTVAVIFLAGGKEKTPGQEALLAPEVPLASLDSEDPLASLGPEDPLASLGPEGPLASEGPLAPAPSAAERFPFDPNTADSTALLRLGLQRWQVRNIYKYRAAGGIYRSKEDFARLYGLTVGQYRELEPYITIGRDYQPAATLFPDRRTEHVSGEPGRRDSTFTPRYPVKLAEGETIDLNTADTTLLQRVPGIGAYYARRIVDYRKRLGGFVSLSQLDEVEGFPHQALPYLTLGNDGESAEKLNVNTLSLNELRRHPYLNYYQARAIVDYRRQNGHINDIDELRLLPDFNEEAINRLRPYVSY